MTFEPAASVAGAVVSHSSAAEDDKVAAIAGEE
jgi:hypothetical protein